MFICLSLGHLMMFSSPFLMQFPYYMLYVSEWHPVASAFPPFLSTLHITSLEKIPWLSKDQFGVFCVLL